MFSPHIHDRAQLFLSILLCPHFSSYAQLPLARRWVTSMDSIIIISFELYLHQEFLICAPTVFHTLLGPGFGS